MKSGSQRSHQRCFLLRLYLQCCLLGLCVLFSPFLGDLPGRDGVWVPSCCWGGAGMLPAWGRDVQQGQGTPSPPGAPPVPGSCFLYEGGRFGGLLGYIFALRGVSMSCSELEALSA